MINVKQAYDKVKRLPNHNHLIECCDFDKFWGFIFTAEDPRGETFASAYTSVDKVTGEIFTFNPPDDFEVFSRGTMIPIEHFDK